MMSFRRDFPHLKFSLNGGVQNANEAKSAILYEGPWPTPGHVESRLQQAPAEPPDATAPSSSNGHEKSQGVHLVENNGDEKQLHISTPLEGATAAPVASCGIGQDCIDDGDRLQHQGQQVAGPPSSAHEAEKAAEEEPLEVYIPIQESDGMIEGVMIGRAAYNDPWGCLGDADRAVFGETSNACSSRREVPASPIFRMAFALVLPVPFGKPD